MNYKGYLICTDIDGTLVNSDGVITEKNVSAIREFQQNGGLFTVSTGRLPGYMSGLPFVPNAPVVAVNGTVIYDMKTEKLLSDFLVDCEYFDILEYIFKNYQDKVRNSEAYKLDNNILCESLEPEAVRKRFGSEKIYKLLIRLSTPESALALKNDLNEKFGGRFTFDRSWPLGVEMHVRGSGKGVCVKLLKEKFCPDIHTLITVGDYENDISMIEAADIGFATENALDSVKKAADKIAPSNNDDAISFVINSIRM